MFVNSSRNLSFKITNAGPLALTGLAATIDGADASHFSVTGTPADTVSGPDGQTYFNVRFAPTSAGAKSATLHIASNDPDESPFDIHLTGEGLEPVSRVVDQGSPISFSVVVPPTGTVQWRKDDVDIPGAVQSTLNLPSVQPWQIGVYSVRVTAAGVSTLKDVAVLGLSGVPSEIWRGLVACYPFDGSAQDLCRAGKPAGLVNTTELVADAQRGGVAQIRGKGWAMPPLPRRTSRTARAWRLSANPAAPSGDGEPFTVSFVIKEEGFSLWHGESLFTMGEGASSNDLLTHFWVGSMQGAQEIYGGPSEVIQAYSSQYVLDDALGAAITVALPWTAYAAVGDGNILRLYRNGQFMGSSPYKKETLGDSFIGRHWWENGANYSTRLIAKVDDLRIYNRALAAPEVQQLFSQVQTTPAAGSFESWALIHGLTGTEAAPPPIPSVTDAATSRTFLRDVAGGWQGTIDEGPPR